MTKRRVVITGLGMISPLGSTVEESWQAVLGGKSGVKHIDSFDASRLTTQISASVKDFDPSLYLTPKEARKFDLFVQFAAVAAKQAIDDAAVGGGFILSTGDQCGRDTPDENIFAMVETARTYGRY